MPDKFGHGLVNVFYFTISSVSAAVEAMEFEKALNSFSNDPKSLRDSRESVSGTVEMQISASDPTIFGRTTNLSAGGVGVVLNRDAPPLRNGVSVQVSITWPDGDSLTVSTRVAWGEAVDRGETFYGLVFESLEPSSSEMIHRRLISKVVDRNLTEE